MFVSPGAFESRLSDGLNTLTRADPDQAGPALLDYYLLRGHTWADTTSTGEALDLVEELAHHLPELSGTVRAYLLRRARLDGHGYSVADVGRVAWYRRKLGAWDRVVGEPWPGDKSRPWQTLRLLHLRDQGWGGAEIAEVLRLNKRTIKRRLNLL